MGLIAMAAWTAGATSGFAQPMEAHQGARAAAPFALALRPPPAGGTAPVIAVLALALAGKIEPAEAAFLANLAASVVVAKLGTYAVSKDELLLALNRTKEQVTV